MVLHFLELLLFTCKLGWILNFSSVHPYPAATFLLKFPVSPILLMCLWGDSELWAIQLCHLDPLTLPLFWLNHWELTMPFSWSPARWSYMTWCKDQGNCHNSSCFNRLHACCCTSHSESEPDHPEILLTVIETFQTAIVASILTPRKLLHWLRPGLRNWFITSSNH